VPHYCDEILCQGSPFGYHKTVASMVHPPERGNYTLICSKPHDTSFVIELHNELDYDAI
jgi:hypothetical protein